MSKGLDQLEPLIGEWMVESPTFSEGRGQMTVAHTEDGKFIRQQSRVDDQRFPQLTQLIGSDDATDDCTALYFGKISKDGRTITGRWEKSEDGKHWQVDFDLNYKKVAG